MTAAAQNKGKATEALLSELHGAMASLWLKKLKETPEELTSAELNTIRQFLKDNNISCDASQNEQITNIIDMLPKFDKEEALGY